LKAEDIELNDREEMSKVKESVKKVVRPKVIKKIQNNSQISNEKSNIDSNKNNEMSPSKRGYFVHSPGVKQSVEGHSGHTSSHRSLYNYGSRAQENASPVEEIKDTEYQSKSSEENIKKNDFSNFLSGAANKPTFLSRSGKKNQNINDNYASNHDFREVSPPPDLPPRDFNDTQESRTKQSLDFINSDEKLSYEESKSN